MFSPEEVIKISLEIGVVYKIQAEELIDTTVRHYFIVIAIENDDVFLMCSTTQKQTILKHINDIKGNIYTCVTINNTSENGLTETSHFNCNNNIPINKQFLINKLSIGKLEFVGNFNDNECNNLKAGIKLSKINDIPRYLI